MAYIPKKKRQQVYDKCDGHCAYCGKEIEYKDMQVDHLQPQIETYQDDPHRIENLMPSCRRCNHYKRGYELNYFRGMIDTLPERISNNYIVKVALDFGIMSFIDEWDALFYFEKVEQGIINPQTKK